MTHGLMFHYFHNDEIPKTQGSISPEQFKRILDKYSLDHHLLPAEEYVNKALEGKLKPSDVCITFDDGLYSQFAIADKILHKKGLTAFYFVYTSPIEGILEKMEVYRTFRNKYDTMDAFYEDFFDTLIELGIGKGIDYKVILESDEAKNYFLQYEYYTANDRLFRYLRNKILKEQYDVVMEYLMEQRGFIPEKECKEIWITPEQLKNMERRGDLIGLHSHTHFTSLNGMSKEKKQWEYSTNKAYLEKIVGGGADKNRIISLRYV